MSQAYRLRTQRRVELLTRIAVQRDSVSQSCGAFRDRLSVTEQRAKALSGLSRSPLFYLSAVATAWIIGRQRSFGLLKKALRSIAG